MNTVRKLICLALVFLTVCTLCACGGTTTNTETRPQTTTSNEKSPEELVREAVESKGFFAYFGVTIGGNEITRSSLTITNVKKITDSLYQVSGRMVMTDVYGTRWHNTFDCEVRGYGGSWSAGSLEYTSNSWTKG